MTDLLERKREMALNGDFKLPKMRNFTRKTFTPAKNVSTVMEEDDNEEFESFRKSKDIINFTRDSLKINGSRTERSRNNISRMKFAPEEEKICTKSNLQRMQLKQIRNSYHGSLVGNLMNSYKNPCAVQSLINFQ